MILLRAIFRTLFVVALTFASYGGVVFARLVYLLSPRLGLALRNRVFRTWARGLCRAFGMRTTVHGTPPRGRFFLISNHVSYLDIMLLSSHVDTAFVAKSDLRTWPAMGRILAAADTIFIDRSRKRDVVRVMDLVGKEIDRGLGVLVFPEGTSGKGDVLLPFKPSLLEFACSQDIPVHWATLSYRTAAVHLPPASRTVCWWGDEGFFPHYKRMILLPGFEASLHFGSEPVASGDRKELAVALRSKMLEQFEPMVYRAGIGTKKPADQPPPAAFLRRRGLASAAASGTRGCAPPKLATDSLAAIRFLFTSTRTRPSSVLCRWSSLRRISSSTAGSLTKPLRRFCPLRPAI